MSSYDKNEVLVVPARVRGVSDPAGLPPGHIRPIERKDRELICRFLGETGVFTDEELGIALELIDAVLDKPNQQDYLINVFAADVVLGYYCVGPTPGTKGTFDLYWIAVNPDVHGRGVGSALIAHAEETIRSSGGRLVIVETSSQPKYEKTRQFYLRCQYGEVGRIRDYYTVGDDLVVYAKYLT